MSHLPSSPLSPLSPASPFQYSDTKTIYDVIYANDNPLEFYGSSQLIQTGACSHLAKLKQKYKQEGDDENNVFENYRSLIQFSTSWHHSRKQKANDKVGKKRKYKEVRQNYLLKKNLLIPIFLSYHCLSVTLVQTLYLVYMHVFTVYLWDVGKRDI